MTIKKSFKTIIAFLLLGSLLVSDFLFFLNKKFPPSIQYLREFFILLILVAFIAIIKDFKIISNKNIKNKLRGLYLASATICFAYVLLNLISHPFLSFQSSARQSIFSSLSTFFAVAIFSFVVAFTLISILMILKKLIYYKRKRSSARNFNLLILFLVAYLVFKNLQNQGVSLNFSFLRDPGEILLFFLIALMVVNSFRNAWVNYLNKREKIYCLWLGIPLIVAAFFLKYLASENRFLDQYSVTLATLIDSAAIFYAIYVTMAFLSLLLHLPTAGIFDRKIREIESFHDLSRSVSSVIEPGKIVKLITEKSKPVINSDFIWFEILDPESGKLKIETADDFDHERGKENDLPANGLTEWIMENKQSVLINEANKDERSRALSKSKAKIGSLLAAPLISNDRAMGVLFSGKKDSFAYDDDDRQLLQAFANQASIALENARLFRTLLKKERFEQELKVAQVAQQKLLPKRMPKIEGLDIAAVCITANEVGGDYFDFFEFDDHRLAIALGDVSGKGAKAAFYMAELKGVIESVSNIYKSPRELMVHINKTLFRNLDRKTFISLIYAIIDLKKKLLVFSRAGQCPLLYCSETEEEARFIEPPGLALGLDDGTKFQKTLSEQKLKLKSKDVLIFYTDGVTEARNSTQREFDEKRLKKIASENCHLSATKIKDLLVKEIKTFVGDSKTHDDLTIVVTKLV